MSWVFVRGWRRRRLRGAAARQARPGGFFARAELLAVPPADCLVIEDAVQGVEAAKRGGMRCVAVLTTNPPEKLSRADWIVPDLTHLNLDQLSALYPGG
jgi:beta-phosphoglucomutase-like phosphatase (HAD superfamily)